MSMATERWDVTLHGYALNDIEAGQLAAIRDRHEEGRGRLREEFPQWQAINKLLGWHDRLAAILAEREAEINRLRKSAIQHDHYVCQTLGKALGYPRFVDDQKNFPGATDADGVCTAEHVPETLAKEAADEIKRLRGWKETAMKVLADWEKVWEELGKPGQLGDYKPVAALAEIRSRAYEVQ